MAHYLPFCVLLSLSLLLWAQMPYGLAVSAVWLCSLVPVFSLALLVPVVMAIALSLLSRRTPRSAPLTRLKRRDRGVLTETLTWNRSLLYLQIRRDRGVLTETLTWNRSLLYLQIHYEAAPPASCLLIAHAAVLRLCSVLEVGPLLAWISISIALSLVWARPEW